MAKSRICPRCRKVVVGRCEECSPAKPRPRRRGSATERGYNYRWEQASITFRKQHPTCFYCLHPGYLDSVEAMLRLALEDDRAYERVVTLEAEATRLGGRLTHCVDHLVPHRGDQQKFWDSRNWRAACKQCHDFKTGIGL